MRILGVGLSKTGTTSLHCALGSLGFRSLHYDTERLRSVILGEDTTPDFRCYDDVDAVLDIPAACFFEELMEAYPDCKCILTLRDEDAWWHSIREHFNERSPITIPQDDPFKWALRHYVYGSAVASEFLFRKRYREHHERVLRTVPSGRLLTIDVASGGEAWSELCPFLNVPIPTHPFPHQNRRQETDSQYWRQCQAEILEVVECDRSFILVDEQFFDQDWFPDHEVIPFLEFEGEYWGRPSDDATAVSELERLLASKPGHIVFAWPAFWWLFHYTGLQQYLRQKFPCVVENDRVIAFDLR